MDCSVLLLGYLYSAGSACVLLTIIAWVAHRYGQLYLHCSLIYLGSFQLFLHSDQPLWGWNNPVQRCLPVGEAYYPRRRRWWLHALTDRLLWCATDDDQRQHHHADIIFSFSIRANLFVFCIERSNITLTHLHVSNCRVRQLQLWHFCRAGLCR